MVKAICLFILFVSSIAQASVVPDGLSAPYFPANQTTSEMTEVDFNEALAVIKKTHAQYFAASGAEVVIDADWQSGIANAFADRDGDTFIIEVHGGLARHPLITPDAFKLLVCHEMGHHLGGAPTGLNLGWPSLEGQSDYFATLKCLKRVLTSVAPKISDLTLQKKCSDQFSETSDYNLCLRIGMAALSASNFFHSIEKTGPLPSFASPDLNQVSKTKTSHARSQCRLDTYLAGALCRTDISVNPGVDEPSLSTCWEGRDQVGFRPRCWFKP